MPRTAVILCIHNSATSLCWWIAHHVAVGFSTLLICDDHSSDGSWDLLQQAAQHYDIRLSRTNANTQDAYTRHQEAIMALLQREKTDFEWILPLSIDEYFIPTDDSVELFLYHASQRIGPDAFQTTTTLPVNWCICGLNGHDQLPHIDQSSPRTLYTSHAPEGFADHRITRSFFRPHSIAQDLPNPFAHINKAPDWSLGRILHDAASTSLSKTACYYYNRNEISFDHHQRFLIASQDIAATLLQTLILEHYRTLHSSAKQTPQPHSYTLREENLDQYYIGSFERFLIIDHTTHRITWRDSTMYNPNQETRLCLIIFSSSTHNDTASEAWIYAESTYPLSHLPLNIPAHRLSHLLNILPFSFIHHTDGAEFRFPHRDESLEVDGQHRFPLFPITQPFSNEPLRSLRALTRYGLSTEGILHALRSTPWAAPTAFAAISAQLPYEHAAHLLSPLLLRILHSYHIA